MRQLHRLYAALFGYFWLACPNCGDMFGGHEAGHANINGRVTCKRCWWEVDPQWGDAGLLVKMVRH